MAKNFNLVFDVVILKQLKKLSSDKNLRTLLAKLLDKIEELGPDTGKLLDSHLNLYEVKMNRPLIRVYYKHVHASIELYVFEYGMKTSPEKQQKIIDRIRLKMLEP